MTILRIALRNLWRHKRRSLITMSALVIGMAVVLFLSGFRNAFIGLMLDDAIRSQAGAFQVHRSGYLDATYGTPLDLNLPNDGSLEKKLRAVPGVASVTPRIRFGGLISNGSKSSMFTGAAIDPVREYEVCPLFAKRAIDENANPVAPISPAREDGILLGQQLAEGLGAKIGDTVTISVQTLPGGMNAMDATIIGYTLPTDPFSSRRGVWVPLPWAQRLLLMEDKVTELAVATVDREHIDTVAAATRAQLGSDFEVHTWETLVPFVKDAIVRLAFVLGIVSTVLLVIVISGVMNTVLMSVYERVREIGTMMALGMRRRTILWLFLLEAGGLCSVGAAAGIGLGFGIMGVMNWMGLTIHPPGGGMKAPLHPWIEPKFVAVATVIALLGTLLSAIYPARKASRLRPVEALRAL